MKFAALLIVSLISIPALAKADAEFRETSERSLRFSAVDVYLESAQPLAAYQVRFWAADARVKIVGIEGGEHPAFKEAPYYDPKAMQKEKVVLAAFSTGAGNKLPKGKVRVATIHLLESGPKPELNLVLVTAADAQGRPLKPEPSLAERPVEP